MATLLLEEDVRRLLTMDEALVAVEDTFRAWARGEAVNVPRQRGALPGVTMNTLCSISTALDVTGVKCYPIVRQDVTVGSSFTMLVYRISTGALIGVLEANGLGQIRTGAASGVATKYMPNYLAWMRVTEWYKSDLKPEYFVISGLGRQLINT